MKKLTQRNAVACWGSGAVPVAKPAEAGAGLGCGPGVPVLLPLPRMMHPPKETDIREAVCAEVLRAMAASGRVTEELGRE